MCLWLGCGGSAEPTADTPVSVADSDDREPTADSDSASASGSDSDSDSDSDSAAWGSAAPEVPDDSVVPERSIVVPLYGIDDCPPPEVLSRIPRVETQNWSFPGGAQLMITSRVIRRHAREDLLDCYAGTDAHEACRNVTANVLMDVAPDGSVPRVVAAATDTDFAECVQDALEDLTLPEPDGGGLVRLRFPLRFRVHYDD